MVSTVTVEFTCKRLCESKTPLVKICPLCFHRICSRSKLKVHVGDGSFFSWSTNAPLSFKNTFQLLIWSTFLSLTRKRRKPYSTPDTSLWYKFWSFAFWLSAIILIFAGSTTSREVSYWSCHWGLIFILKDVQARTHILVKKKPLSHYLFKTSPNTSSTN